MVITGSNGSGTVPGATYQRIARGERVTPDTEGLEQLLTLGLVEPSGHEPGFYRVVDVRQAQERALARAQESLAGLALMASIAVPPPPAGTFGPGPEYLEGLDVINERIEREVAGARYEILSAQPQVRTPERRGRARERDTAALERGVRMRTLYPSAACGRTPARAWVREMSALGGEYRVLGSPFSRGILIDRRLAFIDDVRPGVDRPEERSVVVRDPAVVAFLGNVFDSAWDRALGWGCRHDGGTVTTPVQRAILRELINDRTQELTAKVLDMSTRAVEQQLAALRDALGVRTTHAAIAWWLRSDETELD